jgi:hypothetical protein
MAMKRLPGGLWAVAPRRREFYGLVHQFVPLAASVRGAQDNVQVDGQADFLVHATNAVYEDGQAKVQFVIQPDRNLFQVPVFIGALGRANFPRWMQVPALIPRAQTFSCIADDRQAVPVTNTIRILHVGQKVYDRPFEAARAYTHVNEYDFVANFTNDDGGVGPLAANGTNIAPVNVFADADFDIYKVSILSDGMRHQVGTSGKALSNSTDRARRAVAGTTINSGIPASAWPFKLQGPCACRPRIYRDHGGGPLEVQHRVRPHGVRLALGCGGRGPWSAGTGRRRREITAMGGGSQYNGFIVSVWSRGRTIPGPAGPTRARTFCARWPPAAEQGRSVSARRSPSRTQIAQSFRCVTTIVNCTRSPARRQPGLHHRGDFGR